MKLQYLDNTLEVEVGEEINELLVIKVNGEAFLLTLYEAMLLSWRIQRWVLKQELGDAFEKEKE